LISKLSINFNEKSDKEDQQIIEFMLSTFVSSIIQSGYFWIEDSSTIEEGWHSTIIYLLISQNLTKSIGENVFSLAHKYYQLKNKKFGEPASFEAWSTACYAVLGDPSYRLIDHLKPYSLQVPSVIDLNFSNQVGLKVTNLSDKEVKVNIATESNWIQITEPTISLKPKEEKTIIVGRKANWSNFLLNANADDIKPCRLPQKLTGIINIYAEGEKAQAVNVKGLT
jgi:hypothetical protein